MQQNACLVAVVDDEQSVRSALGRLIRTAGFAVETYSSGVEFMHSVQRQAPQCVVLDLRMPVVNGIDVLQAIQKLPARVPVVIITGDDSADSRERTLRMGAVAYLPKPVDDAMLLHAIESAVVSAR